jgi:hypothetical protein
MKTLNKFIKERLLDEVINLCDFKLHHNIWVIYSDSITTNSIKRNISREILKNEKFKPLTNLYY